jgi:hypothetical protein
VDRLKSRFDVGLSANPDIALSRPFILDLFEKLSPVHLKHRTARRCILCFIIVFLENLPTSAACRSWNRSIPRYQVQSQTYTNHTARNTSKQIQNILILFLPHQSWYRNILEDDWSRPPKISDEGRCWTPAAVDFFRLLGEQVTTVQNNCTGIMVYKVAQAVIQVGLWSDI